MNIDQLLERGDALYEARQFKESIQVFDAVLSHEPTNALALWLKARALGDLGETESAIACYDTAAAADPKSGKLLSDKARLLELIGRRGAALEAAVSAIELDPANTDYRSQYVSLLRRDGRFEEALSVCEEVLQRLPAVRSGWIVMKAEILRDLKRYDAAFYTLCDADVAFSATDWSRWADTLRYEGNHREALRYYTKALEVDVKLSSAWRGKGLSLRAENHLEEALTAFTRAAEADPANATCWVDKGNVYFDVKQFDEAMNCYNEALRIQPTNQYALVNLGVVHENRSEWREAIEYYKRALDVDPNFVDAVLALAWALDSVGEVADALQTYDRALALRSDSFRGNNNKGYLLLRQGQREQAIELFERALASPDRHGDCIPWVNKARALRELGRYDECEACLKAGLAGAEGQNRAQVLASFGTFLAEVRQNEMDAHACFVEAHAITNGSPDTKANLAESFLRIGRYQEAREYAAAAGASYAETPVCCATSFIILASRLLEGDIEGGKAEFAEFESRLRTRGGQNALKDVWDYTGLTAIAASRSVEPMTRFVLLTLIDIQTGKLPLGSISFFSEALTEAATPSAALAAAK
jgi:tetratricopeptide (TPR) repeat protein